MTTNARTQPAHTHGKRATCAKLSARTGLFALAEPTKRITGRLTALLRPAAAGDGPRRATGSRRVFPHFPPSLPERFLQLSHSTPSLNKMPATVQKAAPDFTASAVMPDGSFKTIKLSDYKGALRWDGPTHLNRIIRNVLSPDGLLEFWEAHVSCPEPLSGAATSERPTMHCICCRQVCRAVLLPARFHLRLPGAWALGSLQIYLLEVLWVEAEKLTQSYRTVQTEIIAYSDRVKEFEAEGVQVSWDSVCDRESTVKTRRATGPWAGHGLGVTLLRFTHGGGNCPTRPTPRRSSVSALIPSSPTSRL